MRLQVGPIGVLTAVLVGVVITTLGAGHKLGRPAVPSKISAPENEDVILRAHASGFQVYVCAASPDGHPAWTLREPEADLLDARGMIVGRHYAGPTWKHHDGSTVVANMQAQADSPDPDAIPWLRLVATAHSGNGAFSPVTTIQRLHTKGGQPPPPEGCTASNRGLKAKSKYTADYYFYAPAH
jgi:hypothetical protein